jgi:hypothetical protein
MEIFEVVIICLSLVSCVGICAGVYYLSEQRKAEIQQQGIDRRAMAKLGNDPTSPYTANREWWEPLLTEIVKNPEITKMITPYIPGLMEKFNIKK